MSFPLSFPIFRAFDHSTGAPLAGGLVNFYVTRTAIRQNTYTTALLDVPNANPVVLDANGEAQIWLNETVLYTIVLTNSLGVVQWTINDVGSSDSSQSLSGQNLLINGGMEIWQAQTNFAGLNNLFLADSWAMNLNTSGGAGAVGDYTITRQTALTAGSHYSMRIQRNAASVATRQPVLVQNIETADAYAMQGNMFVLSFDCLVGSNFSPVGALSVQLIGGQGVDESYQTALTLTLPTTFGSATFAPTTGQQTFTLSMSTAGGIPTFAVTEFSVAFLCGFSVGTAGANDFIEFDNIKLEIGTSATPGIDGPADYAFRRCQRRYYKTFQAVVPPAQNQGIASGPYRFQQAVGAAAATQTPTFPQPSWMRDTVVGTVTLFNPAAANAQIRNLTTAADCTVSTAVPEVTQANATFTSAGGSAAGNTNAVHYVIDKRF